MSLPPGPALVIGDQASLVVIAGEDLLDLAPDLAVQPAIGAELAQQRLEVVEGLVGAPQPDLQLGRLHGELDSSKGVLDLGGQGLEAGQGLGGLVLLGQGRGDLLLHPEVVREEGLTAIPDLEGLVGLLGALVHAAQRLEDFQQVVALRPAADGPLERLGGALRLADQHQFLAEVISRQRVAGAGGLGLAQGLDGRGVLAALRLEQAQDQPGGAVAGGLGRAVAQRLEEKVERAALDVVAVDAVQRRAAAGCLLQQREVALQCPGLPLLLRRERIVAARNRMRRGRLRPGAPL